MPAAPDTMPGSAAADAARASRNRHRRARMLWMIAGSHAVDTIALTAFCLIGTTPWLAAGVHAVAWGGIVGAFLLSSRLGWNERCDDHYLTLPQIAANAVLCLGMAWWVPQVGVLVLNVLFLIAAFGALRLNRAQMRMTAALVCTAAVALVIGRGDRFSLPGGLPAERVISALWMASLLARCMVVGQYGARLRELMLHGRDELARANKALERLAARDELTGARNRRGILDLVEEAARQHEASGALPYAVALLDLDHFKSVNDAHGHLAGDEVLRSFVRVVAGELRAADRLGRYGGEEFLLCLPGVAEDGDALRLVERIRLRVAQHDWAALVPGLAVTVSVGVAVARPGERLSTLLSRADAALYRAKHEGRNRSAAG